MGARSVAGFANAVAANIKVMTAELRTEWLSDTGFVQDMLTAGVRYLGLSGT